MRKIIEALIEGYRWPDDFNRHVHTMGRHWMAEPTPRFITRVGRAILWASQKADELLSDLIHPDGPR